MMISEKERGYCKTYRTKKKIRDDKKCKDCGKLINYRSTVCRACFETKKKRKVGRPKKVKPWKKKSTQ